MLKKGMGSLRAKGKKQRLYVRFYYSGTQREEPLNLYCSGTGLADCKCRDHKAALAMMIEIDRKIEANMFDYRDYFPTSSALESLGLATVDKSITFGTYATAWLEQLQVTFSTLKAYKSVVYTVLMPVFGQQQITSILPFHIRTFIKRLESDSKSPKYIKNIIGVLSSIMVSAVQDNLIDKNPCSTVKLPKVETVQVDALSLDEVHRILQYFDKHHSKMVLFFAIGFYMGLRTGEILGLKWGDFDFNNQKLAVCRTISNKRLKEGTKTSERRVIDIPPILDDYIRNHKQHTFLKSEWVFISKFNEPIKDYNTITYQYWEPALKACGIRYRQVYQMRHSFASNSLAEGFPVAWVQQMLGHTTPTMLFKRYGNYIYKSEKRQGFGVEKSNQKFGNKG